MKTVVIYTKDFCPYCDAAKRLFKSIGVEFQEENLQNDPDKRNALSAKANGWRTMPMIFIGDEFVGGFTDVESLHRAGQLLPKVQS